MMPVNGNVTIVPKVDPVYTNVDSLDNSRGGAQFDNIACMTGNVTPSPRPEKKSKKLNHEILKFQYSKNFVNYLKLCHFLTDCESIF